MSIIFYRRTEEHNNSFFFEEFFKFFFPAFEFISFISEQEGDKIGNIIITKIKFVSYGFSDGFADYYIFQKKPLKDFLGSNVAYVEDFANRVRIVERSIIFEQEEYCFSFFLG